MIVTLDVSQLEAIIEAVVGRALAKDARVEAEKEKLLTPDEAAAIIGVDKKWLYRHAKELPFTCRISRKAIRFNEAGLRRWMASRR